MEEIENDLRIICMESESFYRMIEIVVERLKEKYREPEQDRWIGDQETMRLLRIKSRTTLQKYRDEGKIRFSQISKKVILYDRESLEQFIEENTKNTF